MSSLTSPEVGARVLPARPSASGGIERWVERHLRWILPAPAVIAMALLLVVPLVYTAYLSLHEWYASSVLGPRFIWLDNYAQLFVRDERFWPAFRVTLTFTVGAVALTVTLGLGIAHLLIRNFPGRGLARTLVLLPMIATPVAMALVWMTMMSPTIGVLNYVLQVVAALFRTIDALKVFDIVYVMTEGGPGFASETLNLYVFQTSFKYLNLGYASALIVVFFTLILGASMLLIQVRRSPP